MITAVNQQYLLNCM